jgi:hypothetical protein
MGASRLNFGAVEPGRAGWVGSWAAENLEPLCVGPNTASR